MGVPLTSFKEPLNVLAYGDGGTGKTTHLSHMADLGKVLVFNAESGVKRRALERCNVDVDNIEIYDGEYTYTGLESEWKRLHTELHKDPNAYAGVVWDSFTEIHKALLDDVVAKALLKAERQGKDRDEHFIALEDYGVMTEQVRKLVRKYRDLPCHFGASALERRDVDKNDSRVVYRPAVTPALINDIYGWFDIVYHTTVEEYGEDQYCGLFKPVGKYRGKDRFKILPKTMVDPTFDRILSYVEEELDAKSDPVMQRAQEARKVWAEANDAGDE
jgi:hypothetical protein